MKKISFLLLFVWSNYSFAQQAQQTRPYDVFTPSAVPSAFAQAVDNPVNYYSGKPGISIPLYSLKSKSLSHDISLSYSSGGFKVNEEASCTGLGWNLVAGGVITRVVKGLPDDDHLGDKRGYFFIANQLNLPDNPSEFSTFFGNLQECDQHKIAKGQYDLNPDEFYLNFDGQSAKLFYDKYLQPHLSPNKAWSIRPIQGSGNPFENGFESGFTITIENGKVYFFDKVEKVQQTTEISSSADPNIVSFNSAWFLTRIENPVDNSTIVFNYYLLNNVNKSNYYSFGIKQSEFYTYPNTLLQPNNPVATPEDAATGLPPSTFVNSFSEYLHTWQLQSIAGGGTTVYFNYSNSREDLKAYDNQNYLDNVVVSNNIFNSNLQTFKFHYDYFRAGVSNNEENKRLKLLSIEQFSHDGTSIPPYTFEYYETGATENLPSKISYAQDYWGYYNGQNSNLSLIPALNKEEFSLPIDLPGANRETNPTYAKCLLLKKITYPTGGYSVYDYQCNSYSYVGNQQLHDIHVMDHRVQLSAIRTINDPEGESYTPFNILVEQDVTIDWDCTVGTNFCNGTEPNDADVSILDASGNVIFTGNADQTGLFTMHMLPGAYQLKARKGPCGHARIHIDFADTWHDTHQIKYCGGARITTIDKYDNTNHRISLLTFSYEQAGLSSGSLASRIVNVDYQYVLSTVPMMGGQQYWNHFKYLARHAEPIFGLGRTQGSHIGYSQITVNTNGNGYEEYRYTSPISNSDQGGYGYPYSPLESFDDVRGLLIQHIVYNNSYTKVQETINKYNTEIYETKYGYLVGEEKSAILDATGCPTGIGWSFKDKLFRVLSFWPYMDTSEVRNYDPNGALMYTKITSYEYENPSHGQITSASFTNSDGTVVKTTYKYPRDYNTVGTPIDEFTAALKRMADPADLNMQNAVIETVETNELTTGDINVKAANLNTFKIENGKVHPAKEYALKMENGSSLCYPQSLTWYTHYGPKIVDFSGNISFQFASDFYEKTSYDAFDFNGNLTRYHNLTGPTTSIEWDKDGIFPIAKFENANYSQSETGNECSFNGFEGGVSSDGWVQGTYVPDHSIAHTGAYSAIVPPHAPFGPTKDFLPDNQYQKYRFSCWVRYKPAYNVGPSGNGHLIIYTKHDDNSDQTQFPSNCNEGFVSISVDGPAETWNYVEAIIDLSSVHQNMVINARPYENLRIRCYVKNDDQEDLWVDDLRLEPIPCITQTWTYDELYCEKTSSISDQRSAPNYYSYDGFGRLQWILDQNRKVLKREEMHYFDPANSINNNFIVESKFNEPFGIDQVETNIPDWNEFNSTYTYVDGLGRVSQTVSKQFTPMGYDLIQPVKYDEFNRESIKFLPYATLNSDGSYDDQFETNAIHYYTNPSTYTTPFDAHPNLEIIFDTSPLNRIIKQGDFGEAWLATGNHSKQFNYSANLTSDHVKQWSASYTANNLLLGAKIDREYPDNSLVKASVIDENGNESIEFKDLSGNLICKRNVVRCVLQNGIWQTFDFTNGTGTNQTTGITTKYFDTYYISDASGNLTYVISPKGMEFINSNGITTFTETDQIFTDQIFGYHYDGRGRMVEKKVPGKGWEYFVYSTSDQLIMTQDKKDRETIGGWKFSKYDALGRVIQTGYVEATPISGRINIQNYVNSNQIQYEKRIYSSNGLLGYSCSAFPISYNQVYSMKYYDEHDFEPSIVSASPFPQPANCSIRTSGLLVGELEGTDESSSDVTLHTYHLTSIYYDQNARLIDEQSENHLDGWDRITNEYNFSNQIVSSNRLHSSYSHPDLNIQTLFEYDHANRPTVVYKKVDADPEIIESYNEYNELGQLIRRNLHFDGTIWPGESSPDFLQKIDYRYNIRGWLTSINNSALVDDGGVTNDDNNDAFGENLYYQEPSAINTSLSDIVPLPQFNGNIGSITWNSQAPFNASSNLAFRPTKAYVYRYDDLNRLTAGYFSQNSLGQPAIYSEKSHRFDELMMYDNVGNIQHLDRTYEGEKVDDLDYKYFNSGNQLSGIKDQSVSTSAFGFTEPQAAYNDYTFDGNGNLTSDQNKALTLSYNKWNLPVSVSNGSGSDLNYVYDGLGNKIQKTFEGNTRDYCDGIEYANNDLQFISTEEGRIRPVGANTMNPGVQYVFDYFLKDHLGNIRAVVTNELRHDLYIATMEQQNSTAEEKLFYNIPSTRDSLPAGYPVDSTYYPNERISSVSPLAGRPIGHAKVLEVVSGDAVSFDTKYFFNGNSFIPTNSRPVNDILQNLANIFFMNPNAPVSGGSQESRMNWASNTFTANPDINGFLTDAFQQADIDDPDHPKAFLIYLFFNKDFNFVSSVSGVMRASNPDQLGELGLVDLKFPENGYLYIYVTNESPKDVSFDNLRIIHYSNFLIEEDHYYPYGLLIDALCTASKIGVEQNYKYNGKELQNELNWKVEDYGARIYDPVLGRFYSPDPLAFLYTNNSTYLYANCNPLRFIDYLGMGPEDKSDGGNQDSNCGDHKQTDMIGGPPIDEKGKSKKPEIKNDQKEKNNPEDNNNKPAELKPIQEQSTKKDNSNTTAVIFVSVVAAPEVLTYEAATLLAAGTIYFGNKLLNFAQHGKNRGRLEPEELERIKAKPESQRTSEEKQKLKRHNKNTQERPSRQSKDNNKK